jgi:nucleotide-binding universal stress UspA family protein
MKILVAIDGSKHSVKALRHAMALSSALTQPADITLVSVHDDVALRHASRFVGKSEVADYLAELSAQDLKTALAAARKAGVECATMIVTGHVAQSIVDAARRGRFDLIVMGSKGRSALQDLLVGSVARRVVELATVPVLLVK